MLTIEQLDRIADWLEVAREHVVDGDEDTEIMDLQDAIEQEATRLRHAAHEGE